MTPPLTGKQEITATTSFRTKYTGKREFWLVLAALTAFYVALLAIGNRRYVWFDELFTFDFARSESLGQLWYRVQRFDCNPPTVYLLSRVSMSIFGPTPFGLRFPSMVEFYFGSVAILLYVRRKANLAFGVVAVLMVWAVAPSLYYAVEARPYALLFLAFACLLLSWDTAVKGPPRASAFFGISASTLALALAHVFAPFTLFAFVVAEVVRFRRRRIPDYPLWAALFVPMLSMLLYIPLIRSYGGIVFPALASYNTIVVFFEDTFGASIMGFVLLAALLVPLREIPEEPLPRFSAEELALLGCMVSSPILLNLVLMHRHGMFYNRYGITSQVAILAALAIFIAYRLRLNRFAAYAAAIVLVLTILKLQVWHPLLYPDPVKTDALMSVRPNLPIVVGEGQVFMEMNQRENQSFLDRLYFLKDQQASLQYAHSNYFQDFEAPDVLQKAGFPFTANVVPYAGFVREHQQFLLLGNPRGWVFLKLRASGASISFFGDYGDAMPYMDRTLYLVRMPSADSPRE
jgi:hypothetical protein